MIYSLPIAPNRNTGGTEVRSIRKGDIIKMSFGAKLAMYRRRVGITQETLAVRIGIHMQSVTDLERGKFKPRLTTFARIRDALNLSQDETSDLLVALLEEANQAIKPGR